MIAGVFDEFLGVPTHPLAIHAPLVLIPIAAIVAIVFAVRADWRRRIGWWAPAVVFVLVAMLYVAKESGEAAKNAENVFGDIDRHQDLANTTFVLAIIWLLLTVALAVWDRIGAPRARALSAAVAPAPDWIGTALSIAAAVAAVATTIWLLRTGHAGSESRWDL
ncbi:DUF2231 domain-containing protein [Ilumatobacter nonamiensis]|uniref:DUF2231 domain-containing protein n=1 Tax=Ilumatobacter nonamiensis TaxID=467093 RepID=UPI0005910583|nr:DUF2231 domain-containing protein [Ilumatobacter nonamiensis]